MATIRKTNEIYPNLSFVSLKEVAEEIRSLTEQYGEEAFFDYSVFESSVDFEIVYDYTETPEEEAARLAYDARIKERTEAYQRQQYEALKKKFEGQ